MKIVTTDIRHHKIEDKAVRLERNKRGYSVKLEVKNEGNKERLVL